MGATTANASKLLKRGFAVIAASICCMPSASRASSCCSKPLAYEVAARKPGTRESFGRSSTARSSGACAAAPSTLPASQRSRKSNSAHAPRSAVRRVVAVAAPRRAPARAGQHDLAVVLEVVASTREREADRGDRGAGRPTERAKRPVGPDADARAHRPEVTDLAAGEERQRAGGVRGGGDGKHRPKESGPRPHRGRKLPPGYPRRLPKRVGSSEVRRPHPAKMPLAGAGCPHVRAPRL